MKFKKNIFLTLAFLAMSGTISAAPTKLILDHDGAFEDYYAIISAALASKQPNASIKLIAVTTNPFW